MVIFMNCLLQVFVMFHDGIIFFLVVCFCSGAGGERSAYRRDYP